MNLRFKDSLKEQGAEPTTTRFVPVAGGIGNVGNVTGCGGGFGPGRKVTRARCVGR